MTDYSEQGAVPVEDAAVDDPPTESDVRDAQKRNYPEQAETADGKPGEPAGDDRTTDHTDDHHTDDRHTDDRHTDDRRV